MDHSPEYWRGVTAAYDALYEGESLDKLKGEAAAAYYFSTFTDFDRGWIAQLKVWPVKILVPADAQPRPTNFGCAVLSGLAVTLFLFLILGWPKLPAPAKGGITVATVVCFLGAWRNLKP